MLNQMFDAAKSRKRKVGSVTRTKALYAKYVQHFNNTGEEGEYVRDELVIYLQCLKVLCQ